MRGQRLNILAPRGAAKSTYASLAYPLREAVEGREPFITICSDTGDQARDFLRDIRDQLEFNEDLRAAYPLATGVGRVWRDNHIVLRNGVAIRALGTGGKIRGRKAGGMRPTLIVIDDPQNKDHITSFLQRERAWEWLTKDVLSAGEPSTNVVVLGTALHRDCIVCKLQSTPGWRSRVFKSITRWPIRMDLWKAWEEILFDWDDEKREENARAFYEEHRELMHQ